MVLNLIGGLVGVVGSANGDVLREERQYVLYECWGGQLQMTQCRIGHFESQLLSRKCPIPLDFYQCVSECTGLRKFPESL